MCHQDLPYILIKLSFDLTDADRVRISNLLHHLFKHGLMTHLQMAASVRKLYNSLSDLVVDTPNARTLLREHVQFAVAAGFLDATLATQMEAEQEALADTNKVSELKAKIKSIVKEFYRSEDLPDATRSFAELNCAFLGYEIVKTLISTALDASNRQREGASQFLGDQNGSLLSQADIEKGFTLLLERVDDLVLDVPAILKLLSIFIARAVIDEALAPSFLVRVDLSAQELGSRVLQQAQALLAQANASSNLAYAWEDMELEEQEAQAQAQAQEQ